MLPENKFKQIYNPKSNRLKNYDYSNNGGYFITICTKDRENYFGEILDGKMVLNEFGKIIENEIKNIDNYNDFGFVDEFVIMPNHLHIIIIIEGYDLCRDNSGIVSTYTDKSGIVSTNMLNRRNMLIPKIIGKFKMLTSKHINILKKSIGNQLWQPNYYDRIIRNEDELKKIRKYILENPLKWEFDQNNDENIFI
ncbi:MAG: transposase [Candidatus Gracilibacteria bacterium]|nr:transposase [Candidatus Gracilibacteria bacterium]